MTSLPELQRQFAAAMWQPDEALFTQQVFAADTAEQARRVNIYHQTVFGTLRDALATVYPVVEQLVGEQFFTYAAQQYIRAYPSATGDLHDYGATFPDFLAEFPAVAELAYLPDTARLEWAWHEVFHAQPAAGLDVNRLTAVPPTHWQHLQFQLNPACRLLQSDYPIDKIWVMHQAEVDEQNSIDLAGGSVSLLLIREGFDVLLLALEVGEFALLKALAAQQTFADACATALAVQAELDIQQCLQRHIGQQTLVDFTVQAT